MGKVKERHKTRGKEREREKQLSLARKIKPFNQRKLLYVSQSLHSRSIASSSPIDR